MTPKTPASNYKEINQLSIDLAVMTEKIDNIDGVVKSIQSKLDSNYATKEWVNSEYGNQRRLVNGLVVFVLVEFLTALSALVFLLNK